MIAELMANLSVDGHRADIVILKTALAHAAFAGRRRINETDILVAAELALPHRLKRQPFQETKVTLQDLKQKLAQLSTEQAHQDPNPSTESVPGQADDNSEDAPAAAANMTTPLKGHHTDPVPLSYIREPEMPVPIGEVFKPRRVDTPLDRLTRNTAGKRSFTKTERKRGRYIQSQPANGSNDIAFDATVRYAAPHQIHRQRGNLALAITAEDLQRKVRVRRAANLVLFVVDASWSMAAAERMVATKGAIMSLLKDAYQRRDQVGLVVFQKDKARLVLPPTSSVELAKKALQDIPVGGKTPLSSGLLLAYRVCKRELHRNPEVMPLMIILTDGAGNVSMTDLPAQDEALKVADLIRRSHIRSVVINMEHASFDRGLAQQLADALGAPCYTLQELKAEELYQTVRGELKSHN